MHVIQSTFSVSSETVEGDFLAEYWLVIDTDGLHLILDFKATSKRGKRDETCFYLRPDEVEGWADENIVWFLAICQTGFIVNADESVAEYRKNFSEEFDEEWSEIVDTFKSIADELDEAFPLPMIPAFGLRIADYPVYQSEINPN